MVKQNSVQTQAKLEEQRRLDVQQQLCKFKADDSHHGANSALSMPEEWGNRGMAQLRPLAY